MSTLTQARGRVKAPRTIRRTIRLALAPFEGGLGLADITVGQDTTSDFLRVLESDLGQAFEREL